MSELDMEELATGRIALERWQTPEEFVAKVAELTGSIESEPLFNLTAVQFLRDAMVLAEFTKFRPTQKIRLTAEKERWPDGQMGAKQTPIDIEVTEVLEEGRRRGEEYRNEGQPQDGNAEAGIDEGACRLMSFVGIGGSAKPKIDRHKHQSRAMRDGHGEGPKPQLRRRYARQRPRMAPVEKPEDTEPDDQEAGADPYLALPFDEGDQQREGKDHHEHREQMAGRQRPKRGHQGTRTAFHHSGRNGERPPHCRIYPVVKAARDDSQPEPGGCPIRSAQIQAEG